MEQRVGAVVVGAGHAGLAISSLLAGEGVEHVVLERGQTAERWRNERWDSFTLLTPNWATWLPGWHYDGDEPHGFMGRDEVVSYFERYASSFSAPVREGVEVQSLEAANGDGYLLRTGDGDLLARRVVIATGPMQVPRLPAWAPELPADVVQLHSNAYRSPAQLPDGAVLVVGAGPSGQQIADDLLRGGRRVYLAVGRHRRVPRRYRGRDYYWWLEHGGFYEKTAADVPPADRRPNVAPVLTGFAGGRDLDLRQLHAEGATLLGRALGVEDGRLRLDTGLAETLAAGDRAYGAFTDWVDARLYRFEGVYGEAEPRERFPDPPEPPAELDLREAGIAAVVFATGFGTEFGRWVKLPVLDGDGRPVHERGATRCPGVYFLGLHWLHRLRSPFIRGADEDARHIASLIAAQA
jgi:putative flavoprotein involved in K+ transport